MFGHSFCEEDNSYPKMNVNRPLVYSWAVPLTSVNSIYFKVFYFQGFHFWRISLCNILYDELASVTDDNRDILNTIASSTHGHVWNLVKDNW
jgi:hypothetical protein